MLSCKVAPDALVASGPRYNLWEKGLMGGKRMGRSTGGGNGRALGAVITAWGKVDNSGVADKSGDPDGERSGNQASAIWEVSRNVCR